MYLRPLAVVGLALALLGATPSVAATAQPSAWPVSNATPGNTNFNAGERDLAPATIRTLYRAWSRPNIAGIVAGSNRVFAIGRSGGTGQMDSVLVLAGFGQVLRQLGPRALGLTGTRISVVGDRPEVLGYANGRLVVGDTTEVQAFDPATGRRLWRVPGGATFLTISGGVVYTGKPCQNPCGATNSYAIDLITGKVRWVHPGNGGGQPILAGGRLFQGWGVPNSTRMYDAVSGTFLGTLPASVLLADAGGVYATRSTNPGLGCHNWLGRYTLSGRLVWIGKLGLCNSVNASLGYGTLYVTAARGGLGGRPAGGWVVAMNAANGHTQWSRNIGSIGGISLANRLVYVLRTYVGGQVLTLDAGSGKPISALTLPVYTPAGQQPFVIAGGTVYLVNGIRLTALRVIPPPPSTGR
jgi:hypothetical protein